METNQITYVLSGAPTLEKQQTGMFRNQILVPDVVVQNRNLRWGILFLLFFF